MRFLALGAWLLLFGSHAANALTLPTSPKTGATTAPSKLSELQQCDKWADIVRDIASARASGETMSDYVADLRKSGEDLVPPELQLIQRIYASTLSPDDVAALWQKDCYATIQRQSRP
ncbi:hypothetical protein [Dyella japonica]|uniref:Uncharacterized protein n=1 Tax=Dyella japonica TaxID=231455 RepID=A0ABV2JS41_9GAMM